MTLRTHYGHCKLHPFNIIIVELFDIEASIRINMDLEGFKLDLYCYRKLVRDG